MHLKYTVLLALSLLSPFSIAATVVQDPCEEVAGQWNGTWRNQDGCYWIIDAQGTRYNENVRLQVTSSTPDKRCSAPPIVLSGTCKDAKLTLSTGRKEISGTVFSGFMHLRNELTDIQLNKR